MKLIVSSEGDRYENIILEESPDIQVMSSYDSLVERLIRDRYTISDELALLRQRDVKQVEYQQYYDYCEECKRQAKELTKGTI